MKKRTWTKFILSLLLIGGIAIGLYIRWSQARLGSSPLSAWDRGIPTFSERVYYVSRINRIIQQWAQSGRHAGLEKDGRFKDSYKTLFVIDLDRRAVWIEESGVVHENNFAEFPRGLKWQFYRMSAQGSEELSDRIALKMRGAYTRQKEPEAFRLVGSSHGAGHFDFQLHADGGGGGYNTGSFRPQPFQSRYSGNSPDSYGSILVTDSEYALQATDSKIPNAQAGNRVEENEAAWLRVEKFLYGQIEMHLRNAGYELRNLKVEPGPDFSAGNAEIRGYNNSMLRGFFGGYSSAETYLKIDHLGKNVWYVKSARHPSRPLMPRRTLDLEFLVHPTMKITNSQRNDLLARGRKLQQSELTAPSKWKATLTNGATVEFLGICENPSAGKQWWGPDGSPLDFVPYINTEQYGRHRDDGKLYEFAWRIRHSDRGGSAIRYSFEGSKGSYGREIRDRYGNNRIYDGLSAEGCGFDKALRKTTWNVGLAIGDWQTALVVDKKSGERKFLDKQRIILNPPEIENGKIVVRCFEDSRSYIRDQHTDFALILWEDSTKKTVSLDRYKDNVNNDRETGLTEHKFTLKDVSMSQIEGVCFRYRPFSVVTFKNISLVPGEDQGFEIELGH